MKFSGQRSRKTCDFEKKTVSEIWQKFFRAILKGGKFVPHGIFRNLAYSFAGFEIFYFQIFRKFLTPGRSTCAEYFLIEKKEKKF